MSVKSLIVSLIEEGYDVTASFYTEGTSDEWDVTVSLMGCCVTTFDKDLRTAIDRAVNVLDKTLK